MSEIRPGEAQALICDYALSLLDHTRLVPPDRGSLEVGSDGRLCRRLLLRKDGRESMATGRRTCQFCPGRSPGASLSLVMVRPRGLAYSWHCCGRQLSVTVPHGQRSLVRAAHGLAANRITLKSALHILHVGELGVHLFRYHWQSIPQTLSCHELLA